MPYASFDLYLTAMPVIPSTYEPIPGARPGTKVFKTPHRPTELVLRVLALDPNHSTHTCRKGWMSKVLTVPGNSMLQFQLSKDREGVAVIQFSCIPDGAGKSLWQLY